MKKKPPQPHRTCRECANAQEVTDHQHLTLHGRKPILANCPHVTNRKVLLSETSCKNFKPKEQ